MSKRKYLDAISIHALREEGDATALILGLRKSSNFYPRPPRGGRRGQCPVQVGHDGISIHALREEGDSTTSRASF